METTFDKELFYQNACKDEAKVILLKHVYDVKKALADMLTERAELVENKVLEINEFFDGHTGERITESKRAYAIREDQRELFYQLRNAGLDELKIRHPRYKEGYCSACVAEHNVIKHEQRIFDLVMTWLPSEMAETFKYNSYKVKPTVMGLFKAIQFTDKEKKHVKN